MMFLLRFLLIIPFSLLALPVNFSAGIVPDAVATMFSCVSMVSVTQEKVRISPAKRTTDDPASVPADGLFNPVAEGFLTTENLMDESNDQDIRVGCLLPLTGPYAEYGRRFLQGMELALEVYSKDARPQDRKIKLLVRDTRGTMDAATPLVHELVEVEQVSLIIGPVVGQVAILAAKEALVLHIPIITLTSQPGVAGMGPMVFQHFITARNQAEEVVQFMAGNIGSRQPVVLYPDTLFGRTFSNCLAASASKAGLAVVKKVEYASTATDFGQVIKHILADQVEKTGKIISEKSEKTRHGLESNIVLVIPGSSHRLNLLLPQLVHYGLDNVQIFGSRGWYDLVCDGALPQGLKKIFFIDAFSESGKEMPQPLVRYRKRYEQQFKKKASLYDAYGYDTLVLIKQVVDLLAGQPVDAEQLGKVIQALPVLEMVTGTTTLCPDGEIEKRLYRFVVEKGAVKFIPQVQTLPGQ